MCMDENCVMYINTISLIYSTTIYKQRIRILVGNGKRGRPLKRSDTTARIAPQNQVFNQAENRRRQPFLISSAFLSASLSAFSQFFYFLVLLLQK